MFKICQPTMHRCVPKSFVKYHFLVAKVAESSKSPPMLPGQTRLNKDKTRRQVSQTEAAVLLGAGIGWFRAPFEGQLARVTQRLAFPRTEQELEDFSEQIRKVDGTQVGAVLVEPIQGRGGIVVPAVGFLKVLRGWCDEVGAVLIFDEIYTGFWRTGRMFGCEWEAVVPDLICLGKGMSGGFPISVCVGRAEVMDRWPLSDGEALHTSTFLGNPMGCAMALEAIRRYREPETKVIVAASCEALAEALRPLGEMDCVHEVRGRGLMMGIQTGSGEKVLDVVKGLLRDGIIALPDGPRGDVLALTPALSVAREEIDFAVGRIQERLAMAR